MPKRPLIFTQPDPEFAENDIWYLRTPNGTENNLDELIEHRVFMAEWLGKTKHYFTADYSNWDGTELFAICDRWGNVLRRNLCGLEKFIKSKSLFVVRMHSDPDRSDYFEEYEGSKTADDTHWGIMDHHGDWVIYPEYEEILYFPHARRFLCKKIAWRASSETWFDLAGQLIESPKK